jgi:hypothetical protein
VKVGGDELWLVSGLKRDEIDRNETGKNSVNFSALVFSGVVKKGASVEADRNSSKLAGFAPRSVRSAQWPSRELRSEEQLDQYLI